MKSENNQQQIFTDQDPSQAAVTPPPVNKAKNKFLKRLKEYLFNEKGQQVYD